MKDREISRLVLLNIGLLLAIILCVVFFFWLHGSIGAAPGVGGEINTGTGEMASARLSASLRLRARRKPFLRCQFQHYLRRKVLNIFHM